jgi:HSP20 family protein
MLTRWNDPFRDMNRLMSDAFAGYGRGYGRSEESPTTLWAPPVDVSETKEALTFHVELPGFRQEDLKLNVENGVLTLEGERKFEEETKDKSYHRVERSYGKFFRSFALPGNVDASKIQAHLSDGVLMIEMPKREEAKPKSIPIAGGGPRQIESRRVA